MFVYKNYSDVKEMKQEVLGRPNRQLSFDIIWKNEKYKIEYIVAQTMQTSQKMKTKTEEK